MLYGSLKSNYIFKIKIIKDLVENNPCYENYKQMGDALLRIQEPEDALNAYEKVN